MSNYAAFLPSPSAYGAPSPVSGVVMVPVPTTAAGPAMLSSTTKQSSAAYAKFTTTCTTSTTAVVPMVPVPTPGGAPYRGYVGVSQPNEHDQQDAELQMVLQRSMHVQ